MPVSPRSLTSSASARTCDPGVLQPADGVAGGVGDDGAPGVGHARARIGSRRSPCHPVASAHCGPAATARRSRSSSSGAAPGAQPQEVLDVAARPRQRAGGDPAHAQAQRGGLLGDARAPPRPAAPGRARRRRSAGAPCRPRTAASPSAAGRRPAAAQRTSAGSTRPSGMKLTGRRRRGRPARRPARARAPARSSRSTTVTRSSVCSDQASWP